LTDLLQMKSRKACPFKINFSENALKNRKSYTGYADFLAFRYWKTP
jgi:hypothetical protein